MTKYTTQFNFAAEQSTTLPLRDEVGRWTAG